MRDDPDIASAIKKTDIDQYALITGAPRLERPEYVLEPYKWGSGLHGVSGGVITWSAGSLFPSVNPLTRAATAVPAEYLDTLRAAFARWNEVGNFRFVETTDGVNADIHVVFDELESVGSGTLGYTQTYFDRTYGVAAEAYISFDVGRRYFTNDGVTREAGSVSSTAPILNFYTIALHEIGHALGLDHENAITTLMNSYYNVSIVDLTNDEINGVRALYGAQGSTPIADDFASNTTTTGRITVGGSVSGNLEYAGDSDWFAVTLTAGTSYQIGIAGGTLSDPYLFLRNTSGTIIARDDDSGVGLNSLLTYTPTTSGTFYIEARGASAYGSGTYTASVAIATNATGNGGSSAAADDYAGSTSTTGSLSVGGSVSGNLESGGDSDWFRVTLTAGTNYRFGVNGTSLSDPYLNIRNSDGSIVASDDDSGTGLNSLLTYNATTSGTYYVDVRGATSSDIGTYTASVAVLPPDDYSGSPSTTGTATVGGTFSGNIESTGDADWFRLTVTDGTWYRININGATLRDPSGTIATSDGTIFGLNDNANGSSNSELVFKARSNGPYYIGVSGGSGTGTYTGTVAVALAANALPPDDVGDTTLTARTLAVGGSTTATISGTSDDDWFAVSLVRGGRYRFDVNGTTLRGASINLYDANGAPVTLTNGTGSLTQLTYTATKTATYYMSVSLPSTLGTYSASVTALSLPSPPTPSTPSDDFAASTATSGTVAIGGSRTGNIETGNDGDWFRVTLTAGTAYVFDLTGGTLADPYLYLHDADGTVLISDNDSGPGLNSQIPFTPTTSGTYYLDVRGATPTSTGTYTLAAALAPDDYGATTTTAASITLNGQRTGTIENPGDVDWFSVTLSAGTLYQIDVTASATNTGTLSDPHLTLLGTTSSGSTVTLASDDDGGVGNNAQLIYTAASGGTHYIAVDSVDAKATGTYAVSVKQIADDYVASINTAGSLTIGGTSTGRLDALGDIDWFRVTLAADGRYRFFVSGADSSGGTLTDPKVSLYDSSGTFIASADDGGFGADGLLVYTPTRAGTYFVAASGTGTGTYSVGVRQQTSDDFAASTSTTGSVAIGGTATGMIEASGDRDWFRVTLTAGTKYQFNVLGTAPGGGLREADAYLSLRDSNGAEIAKAEAHGAGTSTQITYTAAASGTFYLDVQAYSIGSGSYSVSAKAAGSAASFADQDSLPTSQLAAITAPPAFDLSRLGASPTDDDLLAADPFDPLKKFVVPGSAPVPLFASSGGVPV